MKKLNPLIIILILIVIIVLLAAVAYFFYNKYSHTQALIQNPTLATKEEIKSITTKLSKMIDLPKDEEPTIATVLDKNKLKDQPFFKKAENGDKVIIYAKSLKAILYRPKTNKVVDFSVVTMTPQPLKVALLNGTNRVGLTEELQKKFEANLTGLTITNRDNAKKNNYEKTLIVDLTGNRENESKQLSTLLNGEVSKIPTGEVKPEADILIILGKNYQGLNIPSPSASATPSAEVSPNE